MPPAHPVRVDAMEHASKDWPREAVGGVIERLDGSLGYYPLPNVSTAPDEAFNVPPEAVAEMMAEAQVVGVHHSHPRCNLGGKTCSPSGCDMQAQLSWNVPFYITFMNERAGTPIGFVGWGDQLPPDDLRERTFMSGINDCYSLVRHAYFRLHGIVLPDGPRDDSWWNDKGADNPIMGNLTTNGFERVRLVEGEPGGGLEGAGRGGGGRGIAILFPPPDCHSLWSLFRR